VGSELLHPGQGPLGGPVGPGDAPPAPTPENAERVLRALRAFGAPLFDLTLADLLRPDTVFQIGVAPGRIDLLAGLTGLTFQEAWSAGGLLLSEQLVATEDGKREALDAAWLRSRKT
jgi:hypothetical protein